MTHRLLVGGELVLYGDVGDMWGDGSGFSGKDVVDALAEHGPADLTVRLNSGGGYVNDGVAIYNALRAHPGKVTVSVDAMAASSASVIAMAGDSIVMRDGALMMIHDPSGVTIGTADDHRSTAGVLDKMADIIAGIYSRRTGETAESMRELMKTETWLTADDAVDAGFATAKDDTPAETASAFAYDIYADVPAWVPQEAFRARPAHPVAIATSRKEPPMAKTAAVTATVNQADPVESNNVIVDVGAEIFARCEAANLTMKETADVMAAAAGDLDKARDAIIDALANRDKDTVIRPVATVTADARDRFREGAEKSLLLKAGIAGGEVNEFASMTLRELARMSLTLANAGAKFGDPMAMVGAAFTTMAISHSSSDFGSALANVANKAMLKGWEEAPESFEMWTAIGSLPDFKPNSRVDLNLFGNLDEVPEGAEYKYGTINERGESIQLVTYGKMFSITRQAIINDDLSVFTRIPMRMGRAARRTVGDKVYSVLTGNPLMSDSVNLFDNTHDNIATGALTTANLDAARALMALQRDPDGHAAALNIRPRFLIVPTTLSGKARQLVTSEFEVTASGTNNTRAPNYVRNLVEVVEDARLDVASTSKWYLAADPNMHDTIEVAYLNGNSQPVLEQRDGWSVDGTEFKVRIEAGVKALDYRGLVESTGS